MDDIKKFYELFYHDQFFHVLHGWFIAFKELSLSRSLSLSLFEGFKGVVAARGSQNKTSPKQL